jgi:hypothetical protein
VTPGVGAAFWHGYNEVIRIEEQQRFGLRSAVKRENFGAAAAAVGVHGAPLRPTEAGDFDPLSLKA